MSEHRSEPRLVDLAELAGVSISTVSHVLNGTRYVAPETRQAVDDALAALGTPRRARPVAARRTVGLITTASSNPHLSELIHGIESEADRHGFSVLMSDSHDLPERELAAAELLVNHRVDAVILAPTRDWREATLPYLNRHRIPFTLVDRTTDVACDQVVTDSLHAARAVVGHLLAIGHRRIGMLSGTEGISTTIERIDGYQRAHTDAGVVIDPSIIVTGHSTIDGARRATESLLRTENPPTALFAANNAMTIGAMLAIREAGLRVPGDLALVVFDDLETSEAFDPSLTAVAQPFVAMGARALQLLHRRLDDPLAPRRVIRLPNEIEHRDSCGCGQPGTPFS